MLGHPCRALFVVALSAPTFAQGLFQQIPVDRNPLPVLGIEVRSVHAADVDQDGDADLVVAQDGEIVLLRQQAGLFVRQVVDGSPTTPPRMVAIGDFDNDGFGDVLGGPYVAGFTTMLRIWWGDATGQFPTLARSDLVIPPELAAGRLAIDDVDHDGDVDLVLAKASGLNLTYSSTLLRNLGNRTFAEAPAAQYPRRLAGDCAPFCVDLDGDTFRDVVLVSRDDRTRLFWNNGGNFAEATITQFPLLTDSFRGLAGGDFDADGDLDLALGGDAGTGRVLRTVGPRQLALGPALPSSRTIALVAAARAGNAFADLVAFRREQGFELRNDGAGNFTVESVFGDLDGDGDLDVLRVGMSTGFTPTVPPARGTVSFQVRPGVHQHVGDARLPVSMASVAVPNGDVDGDGLRDFAFVVNEVSGSTLQFGRGDGRGVFAYLHADRIGSTLNTFFTDLDRDGRDEYVTTGMTTRYFANTGGVLAATPTVLPIVGDSRAGVALDADEDGAPELLLAMRLGAWTELRLFENVSGTWQEQTSTRLVFLYLNGQYPELQVADFDGDHHVDVWLHTENGEQLLRNLGGVLTNVPGAIPATFSGGSRCAVGDLDGDGDADLHAGRHVALNNGNGMFTDVSGRVPAIYGVDSLGQLADLDDDGDLDLLGNGIVAWNDGHAFFTIATNLLPMPTGNGGALAWTDVDRDGDADLLGVVGQARPALYTNMLRQFWLQEPARLGGTIEFHYHARVGSTPQPIRLWLACSFAKIAPLPIGNNCWLQIDPTQAIVLGTFGLPAQGGELVHHELVPADPALRGVYFCAQPVELRGNRWRIGGFVETWLGR